MAQDKSQDTGLVSMHSEWVGKSYLRVKARRVGKSATLMVDVAEYADRPSKQRAATVAKQAARSAGTSGAASVISEFETVRNGNRLDQDGNLTPTRVRIRNTVFAFGV